MFDHIVVCRDYLFQGSCIKGSHCKFPHYKNPNLKIRNDFKESPLPFVTSGSSAFPRDLDEHGIELILSILTKIGIHCTRNEIYYCI
jgi:hypothetical protein